MNLGRQIFIKEIIFHFDLKARMERVLFDLNIPKEGHYFCSIFLYYFTGRSDFRNKHHMFPSQLQSLFVYCMNIFVGVKNKHLLVK